ncbi:MAG: FHA domain-containing protein [Planctomycetaceae bacterium]
MSAMLTSETVDRSTVAVLTLIDPNGQRETRELRTGESIFVGSEPSAELCIDGPGISAAHCMLRADESSVSVKDCYSESGTFVNGQRVSDVQLRSHAEVRVGDFRLLVRFSNLASTGDSADEPFDDGSVHAEPQCSALAKAPAGEPKAAENRMHVKDTPLPETSAPAAKTLAKVLQEQLERANAEIEVLRDRLQFAASHAVVAEPDPERDETISLLREEVVELQAALAARDQAAVSASAVTRDDADTIDRDEAERLVCRLEQLLQELQQKDEQTAMLTELLEAAEEANSAQEQERSHLDSWISDIEKRFGDREQEWQAAIDRQQQTIAKLTIERNQAEASLTSSASNAQVEVLQRSLQTQREEAESLHRNLEAAERENKRLQRELDDLGKSVSREEAVRLCQERAELARQRQELQLQCEQKAQPVAAKDSTERFQALRSHLKDIHEQEERERQERSLSGRLSRLWQRLEGR